jgi:hypothetical protein
MVRLLSIGMLAVALVAVPLSQGGHGTFTASDSFLPPGNTTTKLVGGVSETVAGCDPGSAADGLDGFWYDITGYGGHAFSLSVDATLDADTWFYDSGCGFESSGDGAENLIGGAEAGTVPADAAFVIVDNAGGFGAFTITIG